MQNFTSIEGSDTLTESREPLVNNDLTSLSCSSDIKAPTEFLVAGRLFYNTSSGLLYQLKSSSPATWVVIANLNEEYVPKSYVDTNFLTSAVIARDYARKTGEYSGLRAMATTKADVGLSTIPNSKSDSIADSSSNKLATSKAVKTVNDKTIANANEILVVKEDLGAKASLNGDSSRDFATKNLNANGAITGDSLDLDRGTINAGAGNFSGRIFTSSDIVSKGNITAYSTANYSDIRLKEDIYGVDNPIDRIKKMNGVFFRYIGTEDMTIGLIAQEVMEAVPEAVRVDPHGYLSVSYANLVGLLVEAVKELNQRLEVVESNV